MVSRENNKESIKRFYNRLGKKLDSQVFYEQSGLDELVHHGRFDSAHNVFEFGCGTGRLARRLLAGYLPADCRYTAVDISPRMVEIAHENLQPWQEQSTIMVTTGDVELGFEAGCFDRFIGTYVVDLLSEDDARKLIEEAHRVLKPDGLLCLVSITPGISLFSKAVMRTWRLINKLHPILTGGCRPVSLLSFIPEAKWNVDHHQVLTRYGVAIEIVIARRR